MAKLNIYCGDYEVCKAKEGSGYLHVVAQTTETGRRMVEIGRSAHLLFKDGAGGSHTLFTNNDHYMNGIRLAIKNGLLDHRNVVFHFYREHGHDGQLLYANKGGQIDSWPRDFFDGTDSALSELIGW